MMTVTYKVRFCLNFNIQSINLHYTTSNTKRIRCSCHRYDMQGSCFESQNLNPSWYCVSVFRPPSNGPLSSAFTSMNLCRSLRTRATSATPSSSSSSPTSGPPRWAFWFKILNIQTSQHSYPKSEYSWIMTGIFLSLSLCGAVYHRLGADRGCYGGVHVVFHTGQVYHQLLNRLLLDQNGILVSCRHGGVRYVYLLYIMCKCICVYASFFIWTLWNFEEWMNGRGFMIVIKTMTTRL